MQYQQPQPGYSAPYGQPPQYTQPGYNNQQYTQPGYSQPGYNQPQYNSYVGPVYEDPKQPILASTPVTSDNRFPERSSYRDAFWAILFIVHLVIYIIFPLTFPLRLRS